MAIAPASAGAIAMVKDLREVTGSARPHPSVLDRRRDTPWSGAALRLRAAADLLAVHQSPKGIPRSPDAAVLGDTARRAVALTTLAGHLDVLLTGEQTLALRCLHAGLHRAEVTRNLPGLHEARAIAHHVAALAPSSTTGGLGELRLIGEQPRTGDPVLEVADRLHRLRQSAWALSQDPDYSVATLRDLASTGVMVHAHTAAAHGADLTRPGPVLDEVTGPLLTRAAAWKALHQDLAHYRSPGPRDPLVHADALAVREALTRLAPLDATPPTDPQTLALLTTATSLTADIGATCARAFDRLARSGHVHIHAAQLTGTLIGEDESLAHAKLTHARIPAPASRAALTLERYAAVTEPVVHHPTPVTPAPGATRTTQDVHVLTRTAPAP